MTERVPTDTLRKLEKLFALGAPGRGATEAEMMLAMDKAREIMDKYNISLADVQENETSQPTMTDKVEVGQEILEVAKLSEWLTLANAVCRITGTRILLGWAGRGKKAIYWIGDLRDVSVAKALFLALRNQIESMAKSAYPRGEGWDGKSKSHDCREKRRGYVAGISARLAQRAGEEDKQAAVVTPKESTALVLVRKTKVDAIAKWMAEKYPRLGRSRVGSGGARNSSAYQRGYADGGSVSLGTSGIGAGSRMARG